MTKNYRTQCYTIDYMLSIHQTDICVGWAKENGDAR